MKIYTQPSTGSGVMSRATYYGDGSTKVFAVPGQINSADSVRVFKNNQYQAGDSTNYDLDITAKTITFNSAPANLDIITIRTVDVSVDSLISETELDGDGSTTVFTIPVTRDLAQQSYVTVNGVKTSVTLEEVPVTADSGTTTCDTNGVTADQSGDTGVTRITFGTAPAEGSKIFVYLFNKSGSKAFSEMTTTEYTVPAATNQVTLDPSVGVVGPFEQKVIVEGVSGTTSTNRYRLSPPVIRYYSGDGSTTTFAVPNNNFKKTQATDGTVEVWVNGIHQTGVYELSNDSSSVVTVTLNTAPAVGDVVAVMLKIGHDYQISTDGATLTLRDGWSSIVGNDSSTINNEKIFVTTFTNHDQMNMRTERWEDFAYSQGDIPFTLATAPVNINYTFVHMNKQHLTPNHDYRLEGNEVIISESVIADGTVKDVVISYVSGTISQPAIGYRIFKDVLNRS